MKNFKNSISAILAISLLSGVVACTSTNSLLGRQQNTNNIYQQNVGISSVVKSSSIIDVINSKAKISENKGFLVLTASNGVIEEKLSKIPVSIGFSSNVSKNSSSGETKELNVSDTNRFVLPERSLSSISYNEKLLAVKKAVSQRRVKASTKVVTNAILQEGAERKFNVSYDLGEKEKLIEKVAVLKKVTKSAYFWVGKDELKNIDTTMFDKTTDFWEKTAFPTVTQKFAPAPMPPHDVDGDARINIYIDKLSATDGLYGYFSPIDVIPDEQGSNKADMIYINSWMLKQGKANFQAIASTLIHEFQHLTNFNTRVIQRALQNKEPFWGDRWLNEGLSTYSEQVGGFGLPKDDIFFASYLKSFFENTPSTLIITEDPELNYGAVYLFVIYLVEQYGDDVIKKLIQSETDGIKAVEKITGKPFKTVYSDWATALLLSGSGINPKYDFKSVNLHKTYGKIVLDGPKPIDTIKLEKVPTSANIKLPNWSVSYVGYETKLTDPLTFNMPSKNVVGKVVGTK